VAGSHSRLLVVQPGTGCAAEERLLVAGSGQSGSARTAGNRSDSQGSGELMGWHRMDSFTTCCGTGAW
jgi:hypothetical protein